MQQKALKIITVKLTTCFFEIWFLLCNKLGQTASKYQLTFISWGYTWNILAPKYVLRVKNITKRLQFLFCNNFQFATLIVFRSLFKDLYLTFLKGTKSNNCSTLISSTLPFVMQMVVLGNYFFNFWKEREL